MKAITIWQPWASLIACGAKKYETRSWPTTYRGPIAIHAAKISAKKVIDRTFSSEYMVEAFHFLEEVGKALGGDTPIEPPDIPKFLDTLPCGSVIATAELVNVWHIVYHPGTDVDTAKKINVGAESLSLNKHDPDFGAYFVPTEKEIMLGGWTPGRYAWELANVRAITPVPAKGKQGLWNWEGRP